METQQNSCNIYQLAPGFRFHPTDEELIVHYLRNKVTSLPIQACIVAEVDLYKFNPWDLPRKAAYGEKEWFFFTPRERKYPNGARPNRKAASGYWKATGTDKPIFTCCGSQTIGVKKALVFYKGQPANDTKTNWIMHEYRLLENMFQPSLERGPMTLDDWVLCRVRQKDDTQKKMWQGQNSYKAEPLGLIPKVAEPCPKIINPSPDTVTEYLNNGCPLLAYILAAQEVPRVENRSTLSCGDGNVNENSSTGILSSVILQGGSVNNNSSTPIHKDITVFQTSVVADSCISNLISPLKRKKPNEEHADYEYPGQSNRKLNTFNPNIFTYGY
ncbi:hypothetical protein MKW98_003167 [Papaver atlanticum]|uniref:NAC domain-containing protein n=1 Tax=Papaver atlanticum TaxID=357466 RepID=A0AAD4THG2_9MAGN|nr:hypothetical protein MKW98_003167 [Papaver atlanticum]